MVSVYDSLKENKSYNLYSVKHVINYGIENKSIQSDVMP
jgi:hypothetical protein